MVKINRTPLSLFQFVEYFPELFPIIGCVSASFINYYDIIFRSRLNGNFNLQGSLKVVLSTC